MNKSKDVFWLDGWEGKVKDGVYTRCNLSYCIKLLNNKGAKVVGIKLDFDEEWNLELMVEEK